jgi:thiamine biosynthesis lipoprotein
MKKTFLLIFLLIYALCQGQVSRRRTLMLMGSRFDITVVAAKKETAEAYIDTAVAEITRIENLISEWRPETQVSAINNNAGIQPIKVDKELFDLTERALHFSVISGGAFDISFAAMDRIWKYDGSMTEMPNEETIKKSVAKVGYRNIILDREKQTIFLKNVGMKIGFGSIGKGYAADKARELLISKGVKAGIVNASGDMNSWGKQPNGKKWTVGITNPADKDNIFAIVPLAKQKSAVVTSGNYEQFVMLNGKRYSHIINPVTGYPATGLSSVTVFGTSAETANGFSTAIMVLGKDAGLKLINRYKNLSCVMITDDGEILCSKNFNIKKYRQ